MGPHPDCGMVFQEPRLLPWLNVADNIAFGLRSHSREARALIVAEQIDQIGLAGFERAYPHQLSGGMAQRAALARALATRPPVLLLDEPFGALDAFTKVRMQDELLRARELSRPTTLIVTHDIEEAIYLSDRVLVLSERPGRVRRSFVVDLPQPRDRTSAAFSPASTPRAAGVRLRQSGAHRDRGAHPHSPRCRAREPPSGGLMITRPWIRSAGPDSCPGGLLTQRKAANVAHRLRNL